MPAPCRLTGCTLHAAIVPAGGATTVERAFAEELRISVPWSSLGTDPLKARANLSSCRPNTRVTSCGWACRRYKCVALRWSWWLETRVVRSSLRRSARLKSRSIRRLCRRLARPLHPPRTATVREDSGFVSMPGRAAHAASAADDEPKQSAAGWVVGALSGIDCRLFDVSVALSFGNQQSLRVAVGLAHALTVTDPAAGEPEAELNLERLRKEMQLERVRVELSHSGAKAVSTTCK